VQWELSTNREALSTKLLILENWARPRRETIFSAFLDDAEWD